MARMLDPKARTTNFDEVARPITKDEAIAEANRCLLCEDAPCETGCPTGVQVRDFIRRIKFEDFAGAYYTILEHNLLPAATARVCDTGHQCAKHCTRAKIDSPIRIGDLQRFVSDEARRRDLDAPPATTTRDKKVAVVGAGPAGLSCAGELARLGYPVEVFEAAGEAGGTIRFGVPEFRLPGEVVAFEVGQVEKLGVTIHRNKGASKDGLSVDSLLADGYGSVFLGLGLQKDRPMGIPGEDLAGVWSSRDFLRTARSGGSFDLGSDVVVIGGGDTAIDCATVARRHTSGNVTIVYRRGDRAMPAQLDEILMAREEDVDFRTFHAPVRIEGHARAERLWVRPARMPANSTDARPRPIPIEGHDYPIPATTVISAVGTLVDTDAITAFGLEMDGGRVKRDEWMESTRSGVFVGGDLSADTYTVVHAIAQGRRAAEGIHRKLSGEAVDLGEPYRFRLPEGIDLSTECCGVHFENPFILAAAPPSDELDMVRDAFRAGWAGAVLKTTSVEGTDVPLKYPMMDGADLGANKLNALTNIDLISEYHVDEIERRVRLLKEEFPEKIVIASIMGSKKEEWQSLVRRLEAAGADMIECSFSCPQGTLGSKPGFMLGQDPELVRTVAGWIKDAADKIPVVIKVTPQVADIVEIAEAVKASGADGICASNTIPSLIGIDLDSWKPQPAVNGRATYGGLSGPAIRPISLRNISEITRAVDIELTGTGGPVTWRDSVEFMLVGAKNVQFCTAVMQYGYGIIDDLRDGLGRYLAEHGLTSVRELIGKALPDIGTHDLLDYNTPVLSHINAETCVGCLRCVVACRDGGHRAIDVVGEREPKVNEDACVGCNFCSLVCPIEGCISIH